MSLDYQHPRVQVEIGAVVKPHGLSGEVKVHIYSGNFDFFLAYSHFDLALAGRLEVLSSRVMNHFLIVLFKGFDSFEKAKTICSQKICVPRVSLGLKEGEYLIEDYKNLDVYEVNQSKVIGRICAYLDVGEGLFEIELLNKKKVLIPHNGEYFGKPDFKKNQVNLDDKRGLLDFAL